MIPTIRKLIVRSPLHKPVLNFRSSWISSNWVNENNRIIGYKTIYSISPYKTGTTFLASSFDYKISKHEPLHHTSISKLNGNFEKFFVRRLNSLNIKLECSGFLSAYIENLAEAKITQDLTYICILRKPSSWVTSVVNHYQKVRNNGHYYLWGNELYWKKHVGVDLAKFYDIDKKSRLEILEKLINFYLTFTRKTTKLNNVHYVWINDLHGFLPTLGQWMGEDPAFGKSKKNKGMKPQFVYENQHADDIYEELVSELLRTQ